MNTTAERFETGAEDILWSDDRLLGYGPMDKTHREFYDVVFALLTCTANTAMQALSAVQAHAQAHFDEENGWMRDTRFPAGECHIDEHDAVLCSLAEVEQLLRQGTADHHLAHDLAQHLLSWFPGHADYMDSALAAWMSKRQYGGKPVVIKPRLAATYA